MITSQYSTTGMTAGEGELCGEGLRISGEGGRRTKERKRGEHKMGTTRRKEK
jgi:hypothetical protein